MAWGESGGNQGGEKSSVVITSHRRETVNNSCRVDNRYKKSKESGRRGSDNRTADGDLGAPELI